MNHVENSLTAYGCMYLYTANLLLKGNEFLQAFVFLLSQKFHVKTKDSQESMWGLTLNCFSPQPPTSSRCYWYRAPWRQLSSHPQLSETKGNVGTMKISFNSPAYGTHLRFKLKEVGDLMETLRITYQAQVTFKYLKFVQPLNLLLSKVHVSLLQQWLRVFFCEVTFFLQNQP